MRSVTIMRSSWAFLRVIPVFSKSLSAAVADAARLIATLERIWDIIRDRHPDVPRAVIVVASGSRVGDMLKLGHFAALRWTSGTSRLPEVFVAGEGLQYGADIVLMTLLHEAAHALANVRGIKDVSRGGRYHNHGYKELAEELGLTVTTVDPIGWCKTELPDATRRTYQRELRRLASVLTLYRQPEGLKGTNPSTNLSLALCACPRRIRVAVRICGARFQIKTTDVDGTDKQESG